MEDRSPKRRRLSDPSSASLNVSSPRKTPTRSYMSPTKASLSRFNPNLLKSASTQRSSGRPSPRLRDHVLGIRRSPEVSISGLETPSLEKSLFDNLELDDAEAQEALISQATNGDDQQVSVVDGNPSEDGAEAEQHDPAKVREKQGLLKELRSLRTQCKKYDRALQHAKNGDLGFDISQSDLLELLSDDLSWRDESANPKPPISELLNSFLPFAKRPLPASTVSNDDDDEAIASHKPIELKNPLPCLQLFTHMSISSSMDPPKPRVGYSHEASQLHHLRLESPSSLFIANIDIEIMSSDKESMVPSITSLVLSALSPWARPELTEWAHKRCEASDAGALFYGLGSYWNLARLRAECWIKCEKAFSHLLAKPRFYEETPDSGNVSSLKSRVKLLCHLGCTSIQLQDDEVMLRIWWEITFDWTGEAESQLRADTAFSRIYIDHDKRASLRKIPATFDRLVELNGVYAAIEATVAVLFS